MLLNRKFNDIKNVVKTVIFSLQVNFTGYFVADWFSRTVFLAVQILTPLFILTTKFCNVFFMLLDRKFNEDSKNVVKTVIF